MLEDTLVSPELSSPGQLGVPGETQHVAGGHPGQLGLLAQSHSPPQLIVESQDLLLLLTLHTPPQDLPTAQRWLGLADKNILLSSLREKIFYLAHWERKYLTGLIERDPPVAAVSVGVSQTAVVALRLIRLNFCLGFSPSRQG